MASQQPRPNRTEELKQLRRELLQKILDRENQRRAARAFLAS